MDESWKPMPYIDFKKRIDAENMRELDDGTLLVPFEDGTSLRLRSDDGLVSLALGDVLPTG